MNIRQPAVAGTFYPADPTELKNKVNYFLSSSQLIIDNSKLINLLIVPHAGYEYSGLVASAGFKQVENIKYDKVIIIGASHQSYFEGAAVDDHTSWETPLGQVDIDQATGQKIVDTNERFNFNSQPHLQEHSLEVEIPFLQTILADFKLVPLLLGQTNNQTLDQLASTIHQHLTPNTLLVISTDLSHYPNYEIANLVDQQTINAILSGDPEKFEQSINQQLAKDYPNLDTCACGEKAIKVGMIIAQKLTKNNGWKLIKYANSGDITGEKSRVVGYGSLAFSTQLPT